MHVCTSSSLAIAIYWKQLAVHKQTRHIIVILHSVPNKSTSYRIPPVSGSYPIIFYHHSRAVNYHHRRYTVMQLQRLHSVCSQGIYALLRTEECDFIVICQSAISFSVSVSWNAVASRNALFSCCTVERAVDRRPPPPPAVAMFIRAQSWIRIEGRYWWRLCTFLNFLRNDGWFRAEPPQSEHYNFKIVAKWPTTFNLKLSFFTFYILLISSYALYWQKQSCLMTRLSLTR